MVNIALVGLRASGKSTVGRLLAAALDLPFVDTDELVSAGFQESTVTDIWRVHGEAAWRKAESAVADDVLSSEDQVVSMGGGMPVIPEVALRMRREQEEDRLLVAYLDVALDLIEARLDADGGDRPGLHGQRKPEDPSRVHQDRDGVYRSLADVICVVPVQEPAQDTAARLLAMLTG